MKKAIPSVAFAIALAVVLAVWVWQCSGPKVVVNDVSLQEPHGENEPYRVEATLTNRNIGEGEAQVIVRLRDQRTGKSYERQELITFDSGESVALDLAVAAPRGAYSPDVEVDYPPG